MISVEFQQVCLVVHRKNEGVDVVFPNTGHKLYIGDDEVSGEIALAVYENGVRLPNAGSTTAPPRDWIPTVTEVAGTMVRPLSRSDIAKSPRFRAMFQLHGGGLVTGSPHLSGGRDFSKSRWTHGNWGGRLTNWVRWEIAAQPNHTYVLEKDGKPFRTLEDKKPLILTNRDDHHPFSFSGGTLHADDFGLIYAFVVPSVAGVRPGTNSVGGTGVLGRILRWLLPELIILSPRLPLCPVGQTDPPS